MAIEKSAALGHRVARVGGQVEDAGFELRAIDPNLPRFLARRYREADARAERQLQQAAHAFEQFVDVDDFGHQRLAPGEGQHAAGQLRAAHRRIERGIEQFGQLAGQTVGRAAEIDVADHDAQEVVEVVREPAGQLADRFELLGLA